jgi:hypothetical protein
LVFARAGLTAGLLRAGEKVALMAKENPGDVVYERPACGLDERGAPLSPAPVDGGANVMLLRVNRSGVSVRGLLERYGIETAREYKTRSRQGLNSLRGAGAPIPMKADDGELRTWVSQLSSGKEAALAPPNLHAGGKAATLSTQSQSQSQSRYRQKGFVLSFFIDPQPTEHNYRLIATANFTTVLQEHDIHDAASRAASISLCETYGLDVIALDGSSVDYHNGSRTPIPNSSAVIGVYVRDEPPASEFASLKRLVAEVRRDHPGWLSFINLYADNYFQSTAVAKQHLGVGTYAEYLDQFMSVVDPDIICFDSYPEFGRGLLPPPGSAPWAVAAGGNDTRNVYLFSLAAVRNASLSSSPARPFWNYFGIGSYFHKGLTHADATEAQARWQISASLAYGARGLLYFFFTPNPRKVKTDGPEFPGLVRDDGPADHPTEHWYQARRLNTAVKALAPTLMALRSIKTLVLRETDTQHSGGYAALQGSGCGLRNISTGDFIIGCFIREDGPPPTPPSSPDAGARSVSSSSWSRAVLIANFEFAFTQWPTVDFGGGDDPVAGLTAVLEVDQHSGLALPLEDEVAGLPGVQLGLLAGGRRLLLLKTDDGNHYHDDDPTLKTDDVQDNVVSSQLDWWVDPLTVKIMSDRRKPFASSAKRIDVAAQRGECERQQIWWGANPRHLTDVQLAFADLPLVSSSAVSLSSVTPPYIPRSSWSWKQQGYVNAKSTQWCKC